MRALLLVLAACGVVPPDFPHIPPPAWQLDGNASLEHGTLTMYTCCVAQGSATRALPEIDGVGRWQIAISHANSECTEAAMAFAVWHDHGEVRAATPARLTAGAKGGVATIELDLDEPQPLELWIGTRGGFSCCGTTTIDDIAIYAMTPVTPAGLALD